MHNIPLVYIISKIYLNFLNNATTLNNVITLISDYINRISRENKNTHVFKSKTVVYMINLL